ncbi:MAG: 50S ribosomal protein L15 [Candidatus Nealsonbacteria bacterium]|nr:50S ribosomal protein L15 [Candidatus Nealsonbacteria bacterium]
MQLHEIAPKHKTRRRKRVGRGGKKGTYSGRGMKGQKARAGRRLKPAIRSIIKMYPKLRGYSFNPLTKKPVIVNVGILEKAFQDGETVSPQTLVEKNAARKAGGRFPKIKILGDGKLTKKLIIEGCAVSKGAKEIIEKAGGKVKINEVAE